MLLDPDKLKDSTPAEILEAAAGARLGLDHRFLHSLLDRPEEALPAVLQFSRRDLSQDDIDLTEDLIALFRHWKRPEVLDFLIDFVRKDPTEIPDEAVETLVEVGQPALEPLLKLYSELEETESGEVAFILASLGIRDPRIFQLLVDRIDFDLSDTALLLVSYGDCQARSVLEIAAADLPANEVELKKEIADSLRALDDAGQPGAEAGGPGEPFDIWALYPKKANIPVDLLTGEERLRLLETASAEEIRAAAAGSFFNNDLGVEERRTLLAAATRDKAPSVRARAWEALMNSTEETEVVESMLKALRNPETTLEELGGLVVGLAPESDRNEVRESIEKLYDEPAGRAKALEAMWRSMHPSFRDHFSKHLEDADVEVRRSAVWGVGYYGLKSELDRVRKLFDHEELRSDAIFAYALATPGETSRGRMNSLLKRIEKDAHGLSEMEEDLVKAALDERLMLAGKEPFFVAELD